MRAAIHCLAVATVAIFAIFALLVVAAVAAGRHNVAELLRQSAEG